MLAPIMALESWIASPSSGRTNKLLALPTAEAALLLPAHYGEGPGIFGRRCRERIRRDRDFLLGADLPEHRILDACAKGLCDQRSHTAGRTTRQE